MTDETGGVGKEAKKPARVREGNERDRHGACFRVLTLHRVLAGALDRYGYPHIA